MSKFSDVCKGTRARKKGLTFTALDGSEHTVDLQVLDGDAVAETLSNSAAYAKANHGEAREGDHVYDFQLAVETIALACVDPDSPDESPELYFSGPKEVRKHLDMDRIQFLYHAQALFQDANAIRQGDLTDEEFLVHVTQMASAGEDDALPFDHWRPALQRSFTRTLAAQFVVLARSKSPSISASAMNTQSSIAIANSSKH